MSARAYPAWVPDFSAYPDLVVMYLGMRVQSLRGLKTAIFIGPPIDKAGAERPDGLLHYENRILYQLFPLHVGMRWYWRDARSLEAWAKTEPHRTWWKQFTKASHGVGIWHETYHMRGGMEAITTTAGTHPGFGGFMPMMPARGTMTSRHRRHDASDLTDLPAVNLPDRDAA